MDNFALVKERVDIVDFIGQHVPLKQSGKYYIGKCPFHNEEKGEAFIVTPEKDRWECKGKCAIHGDVFDFSVKFGLADDDWEACKKLATTYGITLATKEPQHVSKDLQSLKKDITQYCHSLLLDDSKALAFLASRGITEEIIRKWKIGISDGHLYEHFREKYKTKEGEPNYKMLCDSGIARSDKGQIKEFIVQDILMYPVMVNRKISHWDLRHASPEKKYRYQIPKEKREGGIFFHQDAWVKKDVWIVEGRDDCIMMCEKGYNTVGMLGSAFTKDQKKYIDSLIEYNDDVPIPGKQKRLHIVPDDDEASRNMARKLAHTYGDIFEVRVYQLPHKDEYVNDPHEFVLNGGNVDDLNYTHIDKAPSMIHIVNGRYVYDTGEEQKIISDFVINVENEITTSDNEKEYYVTLEKDNQKTPLIKWDANDWSRLPSFRTWLGRKGGGQYTFSGNDWALQEVKKHAFLKSGVKKVKIFDGYGRVEDNLWIFDNAAIHQGKAYYADENGITWIKDGDYEGVRTVSYGQGKQLRLPNNPFGSKYIIEQLFRFYPVNFAWIAIGYATATIFFREIVNEFGVFPILFCWGSTEKGKTFYADIIKSMTGAGMMDDPNAENTTAKGALREACRLHCMAIVLNEFKGQHKEELIRAWYNLNPQIRAKKSNDLRTEKTNFNSAGIMTNIFLPKAEDVINRLMVVDFHTFTPDVSLKTAHDKWKNEGERMKNRNAGFLVDILNSNCRDILMKAINDGMNSFIDTGKISDPRFLSTISIIGGCFVAAYRSLGMKKIFNDLGIDPPDNDSLLNVFIESVEKASSEKSASSAGYFFFEYAQNLLIKGHLKSCLRMEEDPDNSEYFIEMHVPSVLQEIKQEARRSHGATPLDMVSARDITRVLREDFKATHRSSTINDNRYQVYRVYTRRISEKTGIVFEIGEDDE